MSGIRPSSRPSERRPSVPTWSAFAATAIVLTSAGVWAAACKPAGCGKDTDCRDDRVCENERCVDRPRLSVVSPPDAGLLDATPPEAGSGDAGAPDADRPAAQHVCPPAMVAIPAGTFWMGADENYPTLKEAGYSELRPISWKPKHRVTLSAYCIDQYEVTVGNYEKCVEDKKCTPSKGTRVKKDIADQPHYPINLVNHQQAQSYCKQKGYRLPTEAEWEYAARGTDEREYPWGNMPKGEKLTCKSSLADANAQKKYVAGFGEASSCFKGNHGLWPVGSAPDGDSPFHVKDMAGSVMEWVEDAFDPAFYEKLKNETATNPRNPGSPTATGVVRGGGWSHGGGDGDLTPVWTMKTYWREPQPRDAADAEVGFRCAADPLDK